MSALESRVFMLFSCLMIAKLMEHDNNEIEKVSFCCSMGSSNNLIACKVPHVIAYTLLAVKHTLSYVCQ